MKKPGLIIIIFSFIIIPVVVLSLIFVSILGENSKIDIEIKKHLQLIANKEYHKAYNLFQKDTKQGLNLKNELNELKSDFCFILELAILKELNLIQIEKYNIEIHKNDFWIPYISKNSVSVDIRFINSKNQSIFSYISEKGKPAFLNQLIKVKRIKGIWQINDINLKEINIIDSYTNIKNRFKKLNYLRNINNNITFGKITLNLDKTSLVDKKIIQYIMYKSINIINKS